MVSRPLDPADGGGSRYIFDYKTNFAIKRSAGGLACHSGKRTPHYLRISDVLRCGGFPSRFLINGFSSRGVVRCYVNSGFVFCCSRG